MNRVKGFSLVEMAIVLTVFSLMMGGMLVPLAKQVQFKREQEARRQLSNIIEALYGYALIHNRLPAPINGDELPWNQLGAPQTDPWGNPWRYRVSGNTDPCAPPQSIQVKTDSGEVVKVVAVVLSGGKRQFCGGAEAENCDGDNVFVEKDPSPERFDDLLAWVHPTTLKNRATLAGLCHDSGDDDVEDEDD